MDPTLKPMLCQDAGSNGITGQQLRQWACEQKWDGWRAVIHHDSNGDVHLFGGRNGNDYSGQVPHIEAEIRELLPPDTVIDGELIGGDWGQVQSVMTSGALAPDHEAVRLEVFDLTRLCTRDIRKVPWEQRREALEQPEVFPFPALGYIDLVQLLRPVRTSHEEVVAKGGEGTVWKRRDSAYMSGRRSPYWLKWKHEQTDEAICTGFVPGKGSFSGMVGAIEFAIHSDLPMHGPMPVKSTASGMDLDTRKEMTANPTKWIGQVIEIKHNGFMASGSPRHPQYLRLRSDRTPTDLAKPSGTPHRPPKPRRASSKAWMRNYSAMGDDKLLGAIRDLERGFGDAYQRVIDNGGHISEHITKATEVARSRGLTR